jgi:hypothetical protein
VFGRTHRRPTLHLDVKIILRPVRERARLDHLGGVCVALCFLAPSSAVGFGTTRPNADGGSLLGNLVVTPGRVPWEHFDGTITFSVIGDAPYGVAEIPTFLQQLDDHRRYSHAEFMVHVGDIQSGSEPCTEERYRQTSEWLQAMDVPVFIVPGDNEWSDCKDPLERLRVWRKLFCPAENGLNLVFQKSEFCEHVRWESDGTLFVALNVQGSNNNVRHREHAPRMAAVFAWLDESAVLADQRGLRLAVLMQADPFVTTPRDGYAPLREKLRILGEQRPGRIVLIHGDTHIYRDDEPIPGVRRIEVWGSPFVSWLRLAF